MSKCYLAPEPCLPNYHQVLLTRGEHVFLPEGLIEAYAKMYNQPLNSSDFDCKNQNRCLHFRTHSFVLKWFRENPHPDFQIVVIPYIPISQLAIHHDHPQRYESVVSTNPNIDLKRTFEKSEVC